MRLSDDGEWILCSEENCTEKIKNHAWGQIKASNWFFSKAEDRAWCPNHIPAWVEGWRKKRKNK